MKKKVMKEYYRRDKPILISELNTRNKIIVINNLAMPIINYSFGKIKWNLNELKHIR